MTEPKQVASTGHTSPGSGGDYDPESIPIRSAATVLILADKEEQQRPRRVYEHLQRCENYLASPMPPPQKRKTPSRDCGHYHQLNFRMDGGLEKHPLGSLLPGRSAPRKPVCIPLLALRL